MATSLKVLYSELLRKSSIYKSMDEILYYKGLWPSKQFIIPTVEKAITDVNAQHYYIGLDVSSHSTGMCILDQNNKIIACKAIQPSASCKGNSILSASYIMNSICSEIQKIDPNYHENNTLWTFAIEKYLKMFGTSSFRTQGLFYLAEINGIIQYKCWELLGKMPVLLHPSTARSHLSLKSEGERNETKASVLKRVQEITGNQIDWPQKKRGVGYADACYDMADAFVIAQASKIEIITDTILLELGVSQALQGNFENSPFFAEYVKINLIHSIRKHVHDESIASLETLPVDLLQKYSDKLRENVLEIVERKFV